MAATGSVSDQPFLPVAAGPVLKKRRTSSGRSSSEKGLEVAGVRVEQVEGGIDISILLLVRPDGRECGVCGIKDSETDYVVSKIFVRWGYEPKRVETAGEVYYVNQGQQCYYCVKGFNSRYKTKYSTIGKMVACFGKDEKMLQAFKNLVQVITNKMIAAGKYNIQVGIKDEEAAKKLDLVTRQDLVAADEPDEIWRDEKEYERQWGDWKANNHQKGIFHGIRGIRAKTLFAIKTYSLISVPQTHLKQSP